MPPKVKITKDEIINCALEIVRSDGADAINARTIATSLGCSTQPIFSNFDSMDELHLAVSRKAFDIYKEYLEREVSCGEYPEYKASGIAYIRFAKEEKELFKLIYMCDRSKQPNIDTEDHFNSMTDVVNSNTGLEKSDAALFHLEMWAYVHGIATMFASGFLELDWSLVSKMLSDAYLGLKKQYGME